MGLIAKYKELTEKHEASPQTQANVNLLLDKAIETGKKTAKVAGKSTVLAAKDQMGAFGYLWKQAKRAMGFGEKKKKYPKKKEEPKKKYPVAEKKDEGIKYPATFPSAGDDPKLGEMSEADKERAKKNKELLKTLKL